MHTFFTTILIFFLPFLICNSSAALRGGALTGGWKPIRNVTDPTVIDTGMFAVDEHNKNDGASLKFKKVVKGESQVVAGMNYKLTITAADGGAEHNYVAVVWEKPWEKFRQLTSFKGPV